MHRASLSKTRSVCCWITAHDHDDHTMVLGGCGSWNWEGGIVTRAFRRVRSSGVGRGMYINDFLRVRRGDMDREGKK